MTSPLEQMLKEVEGVNDYSDISQVNELREKILWMNVLDPENAPLFELARAKQII